MTWDLVRVEAYAGSRAGEEPRAIVVDGERLAVMEIVDRWLGSGLDPSDSPQDYFRIRTGDGASHLIRYNRLFGAWAIQR